MIQVHFYWPDDYRGRLRWTRWNPLEWLWWLGYLTIFSGEPCHCILQVDGLLFDWTVKRGLRVRRSLPVDPSLTVDVETGYENESLHAIVAAVRTTIHRDRSALRLVAGVFGVPMPMESMPQSCVTLVADSLDVRVDSLRPISILRILHQHKVEHHGHGRTHGRAWQADERIGSTVPCQDAPASAVPVVRAAAG